MGRRKKRRRGAEQDQVSAGCPLNLELSTHGNRQRQPSSVIPVVHSGYLPRWSPYARANRYAIAVDVWRAEQLKGVLAG